MKFSEFIANSISPLNESKFIAHEVFVADDELEDFSVNPETIETGAGWVNFQIQPVLKKGENKDVLEVIYADVEAEFDTTYINEPQTWDHPGHEEFNLISKSITYKIGEVTVVKESDKDDIETYGEDVITVSKRFKEVLAKSDKVKSIIKDRVEELFDKYEDDILDAYKDSR